MATYALRRVQVAAAGRMTEFEELNRQLLDVVKQQPGFLSAATSNSLGYPQQYRSLSRWESREAAIAWLKSAALTAFLEENAAQAAAAIASSEPLRAFEEVASVTGSGEAQIVLATDWTLPIGNMRAFEESRQEMFALIKRNDPHGWVGSSLYRFMGSGAQQLVLHAYTSLEAAWAGSSFAELREFNTAHPIETYTTTTPSSQLAQLVHVIAPVPA